MNCHSCRKPLRNVNARYCDSLCKRDMLAARKRKAFENKWDGRTCKCIQCGKEWTPTLQKRAGKMCSTPCRNAWNKNAVKPLNHLPMRCTADKGALSELVASADLLRKGYQVFRSVSASATCDMLAMDSNGILRIEVKSAVITPAGTFTYTTPLNLSNSDHVCAVNPLTFEVRYFPDLPNTNTKADQ